MRSAYKFLAAGAVSPFTGFRWSGPGALVTAPAGSEARWVYACRREDLAHWIEEELWIVELDEPIREGRYQIWSPRARLVEKVSAWNPALRGGYAAACALRARDLALPALRSDQRDRFGRATDPESLAAAARASDGLPAVAAYAGDAAMLAQAGNAAAASYMACLAAASARGEAADFEVERRWQSRWIAGHLPPA